MTDENVIDAEFDFMEVARILDETLRFWVDDFHMDHFTAGVYLKEQFEAFLAHKVSTHERLAKIEVLEEVLKGRSFNDSVNDMYYGIADRISKLKEGL